MNEQSSFDPQHKIEQLFDRFFNAVNTSDQPPDVAFYTTGSAINDPQTLEDIAAEVDALDRLWPNQGAVHLLKGHLATEQGNIDLAIEEYEKAFNGEQSAFTRDKYEPLFALGTAYFRKGNFAAASEAFGECVRDRGDDYRTKVDAFFLSRSKSVHPIAKGVVEVHNPDKGSFGTGFLISNDLIVTCAHVVGASPHVLVRFYGHHDYFQVSTIKLDFRPHKDVTVLAFSQTLPKGVKPLCLGSTDNVTGHKVYSLGFALIFHGMWATGEVLGIIEDEGLKYLQVKSNELTSGFSGAPIWDEASNKVIGMHARSTYPNRLNRLIDVGFAIPVEALKEFLKPKPISPKDSKSSKSSGGSGEGCFIATAAYGTPHATDIAKLRQFRDNHLLQSSIGQRFVQLYYKFSPPIADFISTKSTLKFIIRTFIHRITKYLPE